MKDVAIAVEEMQISMIRAVFDSYNIVSAETGRKCGRKLPNLPRWRPFHTYGRLPHLLCNKCGIVVHD